MNLSITKVLLGLLVAYILYSMFVVREGLEDKTTNTMIILGVGIFLAVVGSYFLTRGSFYTFSK
jgi:hypothetical protein